MGNRIGLDDADTLVSNGTWSGATHIEEELLVKQVVASVRKALH